MVRKADAGGIAVALAVAKIGLYPIAYFLGGKIRLLSVDGSLFLQTAGQLFVALHGQRVSGGAQCQLFHFILALEFDKLVHDAAHLVPVAFNALRDLGQLGNRVRLMSVTTQTLAQSGPGLRTVVVQLVFKPGK